MSDPWGGGGAMRDGPGSRAGLPEQQRAIGARCVHPTGVFTPFGQGEIEQSLARRFECQARMLPERVAVSAPDRAWTYRELNVVANRVARALQTHGAPGGPPVALLMTPGATAIAALLGVFKVGGIAVALDPAFPLARIRYILEDSQAGLIVADGEHVALAQGLAPDGCRVLSTAALDARLLSDDLSLRADPGSPAYLLYTSGSTGRSKGVVQIHRSRLHDVMTYTNGLHISPDDRLALLYPYCTGMGTAIVLCALLNGATLCLYDMQGEGAARLAPWLVREEVTIFFSIPAVFRQLVGILTGREDFSRLRVLHVGTERVSPRDVQLYRAHFPPGCILVTGLASNETGRTCRYFVDKFSRLPDGGVPVGYPVDGVEVLLLDDDGHPVGSDQAGEIVVRSRYLSGGYWRRPELTEAAFRPDPTGGEGRLFRTGDVGLMLPDGCLFHRGRKDFRAKVRGYSVEGGEIEMALLALGGIEEAVVVAREGPDGDQRLVAYLVPAEPPAPPADALRRALVERLPDYMIPSDFVWLHSLPRTPNGKVDRLALPAPGGGRPALSVPFVAPRNALEGRLAAIWAEVLGRGDVGIHDDFLELGGNSLLAMQVVSRVGDAWRVQVALPSLLAAPTVAQMAVVVLQHLAVAEGPAGAERVLAEIEALPEAAAQAEPQRPGPEGDASTP